MEELIVIAVIAAVFVFRIVSRKLNSAAKNSEVFPPIQVDPNLEKALKAKVETVPEPAVSRISETDEVTPEVEEAPRMLDENSVSPILKEIEPKKKEKIDPKKLVVYSEIMKPKYFE